MHQKTIELNIVGHIKILITELPALVEQKSKQTLFTLLLRVSMSLPFNHLPYLIAAIINVNIQVGNLW
jgi:hypothetical protein